jgi:hypothetical protein
MSAREIADREMLIAAASMKPAFAQAERLSHHLIFCLHDRQKK